MSSASSAGALVRHERPEPRPLRRRGERPQRRLEQQGGGDRVALRRRRAERVEQRRVLLARPEQDAGAQTCEPIERAAGGEELVAAREEKPRAGAVAGDDRARVLARSHRDSAAPREVGQFRVGGGMDDQNVGGDCR